MTRTSDVAGNARIPSYRARRRAAAGSLRGRGSSSAFPFLSPNEPATSPACVGSPQGHPFRGNQRKPIYLARAGSRGALHGGSAPTPAPGSALSTGACQTNRMRTRVRAESHPTAVVWAVKTRPPQWGWAVAGPRNGAPHRTRVATLRAAVVQELTRSGQFPSGGAKVSSPAGVVVSRANASREHRSADSP